MRYSEAAAKAGQVKLHGRYDIICSGSGLSTYLCAALLLKQGARVLVVDEPGAIRSARYGAEDLLFDPDYSRATRLSPQGAMGKSLAEIGLVPLSDRAQGSATGRSKLGKIVQIVSGKYRLPFSSDVEQTKQEIRREIEKVDASVFSLTDLLYGAIDKIPSFVDCGLNFGEATASDLAAWRSYWGASYGKLHRDKPIPFRDIFPEGGALLLDDIASAVLGSCTYSAPFNIGCEQAFRALSAVLSGQYECWESAEDLRLRIENYILEHGGAVKHNGRVESLVTTGKNVSGILLSSYEGIIHADVVVLGNTLKRLYGTLPGDLRDSSVLRGLNRLEPSHWRFTISVALDRNAIPIGATQSMVAVGSNQHPLEEENFVRIEILDKEGRGDVVTVLLTALVPYRASSLDYAFLRKLAGKMVRVLTNVMPFAENNIQAVYPDFRKGDEALKKVYAFEGADWIPENLFQYYVRGDRLAQDFWGPSWATPHRSLYFAGRAVWPSLGTYGEALVARKIYEDIMSPGNRGRTR